MKKEVLIAVFFGLVVGLVITIGMYRARTALEETPAPDALALTNQTQDQTPTPTSAPTSVDGLIVREPVEEALSSSANIQVSGSTFPNRTIVILHNEKEVLGSSDVQGNFSIPLTLVSGANVVRIRVLNPGAQSIELVRTVVYELPLGIMQAETASPSASPSAKKKSL